MVFEENVFSENINYNNFNIFIRDLSIPINTNIKHMIEDMVLDKNRKEEKGKKSSKKKHIKKSELIIKEQNEKRRQKLIDKDNQFIEFSIENLDLKNPYIDFNKLKTEEGKLNFKLELFNKYYKNPKYLHHTLNLYFHLKDTDQNKLSEKQINLFIKFNKKLEKYDCKFYMFDKLGHLLPPLNFWDKGEMKLDNWQIDIITRINKNESILIKAPTSSGKTFISLSAGIFHTRVLYVCPAKPVAYQIGAHFKKMNYKVHFLIDGHAHLPISSSTTIFIGTPDIIEKYLYRIGTHFDYVVYDEIHNINQYYENIIRLLNCNFLALSATISNSEELFNQLKNISTKDIFYFEYTERFINQQRYIWYNNNLNKLHPCVCLDTNNFESFNEINFTPNDLANLFTKLESEFENTEIEDEIDAISPDNYFKEDRLLPLNDSKVYEKLLKEKMREFSNNYPFKINKIINDYRKFEGINSNTCEDDFIELFQACKQKKLLPMLFFHTDEGTVNEIFHSINKKLHSLEIENYPYHYDILEKKNNYYHNYSSRREAYKNNIKIKTNDPRTEITEKLENFDKSEKDKYILYVSNYYDKCLLKCTDLQKKNLYEEKNTFLKNPDFRKQDIFKKHSKFTFTENEPMSGDEIRTIKKEILKSTGIKINYEDPLFQLLKRGIGIYTKNNSSEYNWIVQRLLSEKKLAIVLSDRTLCLGIDLPIRTTCLTGYKNSNFTKEDYLQMAGRAGRRGKDNQGNIIFHNIDNYLELMKGNLPKIHFQNKRLSSNYSVLKLINKNINIDKLNMNHKLDNKYTNDKLKLIWYLRNIENSLQFIDDLEINEKKLFTISDKQNYVLNLLFDLCNLDKEKYSIKYSTLLFDTNLKNIKLLCKDICNSIHKIKYKYIYDSCLSIFNHIN